MNEIDIAFLVAVYSEVVVAASDLSLKDKLQEQIDFLDDYRNADIGIRHSLLVDFPSDLKIDLNDKKELSSGVIKQLVSNIEDLPRCVFETRKTQRKDVSQKTLKAIKRDLELDSIEDVIDRLMRFHLYLKARCDKKSEGNNITIFAFLSKVINGKDKVLRELKSSYYGDTSKENILSEGIAPYKLFTREAFAENLKRFPFYKTFSDGSEYFIYEEDDNVTTNRNLDLKAKVQEHVANLNHNNKRIQITELARMANIIFQTLYLQCDTTYRSSSYDSEFEYYLASVGVFSLEELIALYDSLRAKLETTDVVMGSSEDIRIEFLYRNVESVLRLSNNKLPEISEIISYLNEVLVKDFIKNALTKNKNNTVNLSDLQRRCSFMTLDDVKDFKEQVINTMKKRGVKTRFDFNACENIKEAFGVIEDQKKDLGKDSDDYSLKIAIKPNQS